MAKPKPQPEQPGIALDSVAAHFQRQAAYFQNEALRLSAQVRDMDNVIQHQARQIASMMTPAVQVPAPTSARSRKKA